MEVSIDGARIEATYFKEVYFEKINPLNTVIANPLNIDKISHISIYIDNSNILEYNAALIKLVG